jgi:hypothetical protein
MRATGLKAMADSKLLAGGSAVITAAVLALEDHTKVEGGIWNDRLGLPQKHAEKEVVRIVKAIAS